MGNDSPSTFQVWYHEHTNPTNKIFGKAKELLKRGMNVTVDPTYILKVTWDKMAPAYASKLSEVSFIFSFIIFLIDSSLFKALNV